jgi:tetratricopeptide (TPR) repeat protein
MPVIGIIQIGEYAMTDRYHYLPSIGFSLMLAWGVPLLFRREDIGKKVLFPAGIAVLTIMAILTWRQCGYWKNSFELDKHILKVTKNGSFAHNLRGVAYCDLGRHHEAIDEFNQAINLDSNYASAYNNRGITYFLQGNNELGCRDAQKACALRKCKLLEGAKGKGYCR